MSKPNHEHELAGIPNPDTAIAVVGMACRFPGANDLARFWDLLRQGREAIRDWSDDELSAHVDAALLDDAAYVKAQALLDDPDLFDAGLFGLTPKEAGLMDPQQRVFLEVVYSALEHAGLAGRGERIGLFAGSDTNGYVDGLRNDAALLQEAGELQMQIGNVKDHLTLRTSYLLDLRGPSVPVQTTCSTSLVAIHQAVQSLLNMECDAALAGGVAIPIPYPTGYRYEPGGALSPDGHCRAFDADGQGTALGSGAGAVVLKRLDDALADGDAIHAVVLGTAVNNDGADKVGYTAPSVSGQRGVITEAMSLADVAPSAIGYVEAHGTGTTLGDPIEIEALRQAFGDDVEPGSCAIGTVKTNIGHANSAAGVAGFIKAVLCLQNATLVPSLNFAKPNPALQLEQSPFYVNTETRPWDADQRVAGVSSFGIGGTNAHAILCGPPTVTAETDARPADVVCLSASTKTALTQRCKDLASWLETQPDANLADVARTLNLGRHPLNWRAAFAATDCDELAAKLAKPGATQLPDTTGQVVFLFPGQGSDYERFGAELYQTEPVFRAAIDTCHGRLQPKIGENLVHYMFSDDPADRERLKQPDLWQPALFTSEYAAAQLWLSWGYQPTAMIGHSIGEYVAAVLAGVMTLENALDLIAERGLGTKALPTGAMMAAVMPQVDAEKHLSDTIDLAAVNGPRLSVFSGTDDAINTLEKELKDQGVHVIRLPATHAFHSHMMSPLIDKLDQLAAGFDLKAPQIPMLSNVTGTWFGADDVANPKYWGQHLRGTVRFNDGLDVLAEKDDLVFVEVGPGRVLSGLVKRHPKLKRRPAVHTLDKAEIPDLVSAYGSIGELFKVGLVPDWQAFYGDSQAKRLALPTYPFERERYWLGKTGAPAVDDGVDVRREPSEWCYVPGWQLAAPLSRATREARLTENRRWLVFADEMGVTAGLIERLRALGHDVLTVTVGDHFQQSDDTFALNPENPDDVLTLVETLAEAERLPDQVLHGWRLDTDHIARDNMERLIRRGFDNLLHLARAFASQAPDHNVQLTVLTNGMSAFAGDDHVYADKAALWGAAWVIPKEFPLVRCRTIDLPPDGQIDQVDNLLATAIDAESNTLAMRYGQCWVLSGTRTSVPEAPSMFRDGGVYLLTNGLREMGLYLAEYLAKNHKATVVLTDRTFFPPAAEWDQWIAEQGEDDLVSKSLRRLQPLIAQYDTIHVRSANAAAPDRMRNLHEEIVRDFGALHMVIHLDSLTRSGLIQGKAPDESSLILAAKMREALNVADIFADAEHLVFFAENPAEGGIGKVEQGAAYAFLDAFAYSLSVAGRSAKTIDWGTLAWEESADDLSTMAPHIREQLAEKRNQFGMSLEAARDTFARAMDLDTPRVVVSTRDFDAVMAQQDLFDTNYFRTGASEEGADAHTRPDLSSDYAEPTNDVERLLADIWATFFGLDKVGIHDNFFELGGHSLLAVQLLSKINNTFASRIVLKHLFDAPTPAELADLLADSGTADEGAEDVDALLAEIEGLSADEIQRALNSEG